VGPPPVAPQIRSTIKLIEIDNQLIEQAKRRFRRICNSFGLIIRGRFGRIYALFLVVALVGTARKARGTTCDVTSDDTRCARFTGADSAARCPYQEQRVDTPGRFAVPNCRLSPQAGGATFHSLWTTHFLPRALLLLRLGRPRSLPRLHRPVQPKAMAG
jgi:hypothetical protein